MKNVLKGRFLGHLIAIASIVIVLFTSSCGVARLAKVGQELTLKMVEKVELKGLTALQLVVQVSNESRLDVAMEEGEITLYSNGKRVATLIQEGVLELEAKSEESLTMIWKLKDVDPMTLLSISGKVVKRNFDGFTIDYSAKLSAGKISRTISLSGIELTKFIPIFDAK